MVCCTFQKVLIDCGIIRPLIVRMMEIKLSGLIIKGAETEGNHLGIYVLYSTIGLCLHICYQNCIIHTSLENELCKHNNNIIIISKVHIKVHTTIHPHTKVMEFLRYSLLLYSAESLQIANWWWYCLLRFIIIPMHRHLIEKPMRLNVCVFYVVKCKCIQIAG